jgi:hypothetical protein
MLCPKAGEAGTEALVYVSIEPAKRAASGGAEAEADADAPALLLHSSVPFGIACHRIA